MNDLNCPGVQITKLHIVCRNPAGIVQLEKMGNATHGDPPPFDYTVLESEPYLALKNSIFSHASSLVSHEERFAEPGKGVTTWEQHKSGNALERAHL
jgi:hypothetical protein